jgi:hypothetical protein
MSKVKIEVTEKQASMIVQGLTLRITQPNVTPEELGLCCEVVASLEQSALSQGLLPEDAERDKARNKTLETLETHKTTVH